MKREIIIGVIAALVASFLTYLISSIRSNLTKVELQEIANNVVSKDSFRTVLLNEFSKDDRFKGKDGAHGINNLVKSGNNWCASLGSKNKICWGLISLSTSNNHVRVFDFTFAKPFSSPPVITNGINANSSGWAFSVYQHSLTKFKYSGAIVENSSAKNKAPVTMNYIAIGD